MHQQEGVEGHRSPAGHRSVLLGGVHLEEALRQEPAAVRVSLRARRYRPRSHLGSSGGTVKEKGQGRTSGSLSRLTGDKGSFQSVDQSHNFCLNQDDGQDSRDSYPGSSQDGYGGYPPSYNNFPPGDPRQGPPQQHPGEEHTSCALSTRVFTVTVQCDDKRF